MAGGQIATLLTTALGIILAYITARIVNRLFLDDLSKIPGPKINALTRLPYVSHLIRGTTVQQTLDLHKKYGDVVRISPNEVSFISIETAFDDIYGFRTGKMKGRPNLAKDPVWYPPPVPGGARSILTAGEELHQRSRRLYSHAFSEQALREQEPILQKYADQLIDGLRETSAGGASIDVAEWFNWLSFDIVTDLLFGESLGSLQARKTHRYVSLVFKAVMMFRSFYIVSYYPWMKYFGGLLVDKNFLQERSEYFSWVGKQIQHRRERETTRPDFMTHVLQHIDDRSSTLTTPELVASSTAIITAGSETTSSFLSGTLYLLLTHPPVLARLTTLLRKTYPTADSITLSSLSTTSAPRYLLAVLSEALRYFPPVPCGFERRIGVGGEVISGVFLPEGTSLAVSHLAAYRDERHFKDANRFLPERWLGEDERYANDKREFCLPFNVGPRNCLGKNLAYAEMRLIVAKLLWTFDLSLNEESRDWMSRCRVKTLWWKPPLMIKLTEAVR